MSWLCCDCWASSRCPYYCSTSSGLARLTFSVNLNRPLVDKNLVTCSVRVVVYCWLFLVFQLWLKVKYFDFHSLVLCFVYCWTHLRITLNIRNLNMNYISFNTLITVSRHCILVFLLRTPTASICSSGSACCTLCFSFRRRFPYIIILT